MNTRLAADRDNQAVAPSGLTAVTVSGTAALYAVRDEIADLSVRCKLPTTASADWIFATLAADGSSSPWAVLVRDAPGRLHAAMILAVTDNQIRIVGTDQGNRAVIAAESSAAAETLAEGVHRSLRGRDLNSIVVLGPLDAQHSHTQLFSAALQGSTLLEADPIPLIRNEGQEFFDYLTHGMKRQMRKVHNRLKTDARSWSVAVTVDPDVIRQRLPILEACHRERDHAHGRASALDDEAGLQLWRARIEALSRAGDLELAELSIDNEFAAYTLSVFDGHVFRIIEGRFTSEWARYSPGRLLEAHIVERVLAEDSIHIIDWMTATAAEKLLATNDSDAMVYVNVL